MIFFSKKQIFIPLIFLLILNGCAAKNKFSIGSQSIKNNKKIWMKVQSIDKEKREDCVDCYASSLMDYSKPSIDKAIKVKSYGAYDYIEKPSDTKSKRDSYRTSNKYVVAPSYVNSAYGRYNSTNNTAIQVGAFRKYSGAKLYMKRYNALSSRYRVTIKTGTKDSKPLHRVRIEGFKDREEAKKFIYSYGISDAFVVIK